MLTSCVFVIAAALAQDPSTIVDVEVRHHRSVPSVSNEVADQILDAAGHLLRHSDGTGDVGANIRYRRILPVSAFDEGNGIVNSSSAFHTVHMTRGNVKIVESITWCGRLNASAVGCAKVGFNGMSIVVERYLPEMEGVLWSHEYGHNRGLHHRDEEHALMASYVGVSHGHLNQDEADAFVNGPADVEGLEVQPATRPQEPVAVGDVRTFVRRTYMHGIPYETASRLPKEHVPTLVEMLKNPEERPYWTNIVTTLGFMGHDEAAAPLMEFVAVGNEEMDSFEFRAKEGTLIHLGDLINKTQNKEALTFLSNIAIGDVQEGLQPLVAQEGANDRLSHFQVAAIFGLALSGQPQALETIRERGRFAAANAPDDRAALAEAEQIYQRVVEVGLKAYRLSDEAEH